MLQGSNSHISYSASKASAAKVGLQAQRITYSSISFPILFFNVDCTSIWVNIQNHSFLRADGRFSRVSEKEV
jgi:hypothetical protein